LHVQVVLQNIVVHNSRQWHHDFLRHSLDPIHISSALPHYICLAILDNIPITFAVSPFWTDVYSLGSSSRLKLENDSQTSGGRSRFCIRIPFDRIKSSFALSVILLQLATSHSCWTAYHAASKLFLFAFKFEKQNRDLAGEQWPMHCQARKPARSRRRRIRSSSMCTGRDTCRPPAGGISSVRAGQLLSPFLRSARQKLRVTTLRLGVSQEGSQLPADGDRVLHPGGVPAGAGPAGQARRAHRPCAAVVAPLHVQALPDTRRRARRLHLRRRARVGPPGLASWLRAVPPRRRPGRRRGAPRHAAERGHVPARRRGRPPVPGLGQPQGLRAVRRRAGRAAVRCAQARNGERVRGRALAGRRVRAPGGQGAGQGRRVRGVPRVQPAVGVSGHEPQGLRGDGRRDVGLRARVAALRGLGCGGGRGRRGQGSVAGARGDGQVVAAPVYQHQRLHLLLLHRHCGRDGDRDGQRRRRRERGQ
jgi:hypothetical protein